MASIVSLDDLKIYFKGSAWKISYADSHSFEAESNLRKIFLKVKSIIFKLHVEAIDDPSDVLDIKTESPTKSLVEFLETGTKGDEFLKKAANCSPDSVIYSLQRIAERIREGKLSNSMIKKALNRITVFPDLESFKSHISSRSHLELEEISMLKGSLQKKGWKVSENQTDDGLPSLHVDISDIYVATISVESIIYGYRFQVKGRNEVIQEGTTDDPIAQYRKYKRDEEVIQASRELEIDQEHDIPNDSQNDITKRPVNLDDKTQRA